MRMFLYWSDLRQLLSEVFDSGVGFTTAFNNFFFKHVKVFDGYPQIIEPVFLIHAVGINSLVLNLNV
ncbi:hypothetical protein DespoDRAFT_00474 [Desulfobacter postgatei 2ac9]|uniref:Uncharacterized protein n=1 Tax=Desulfobacter postgatei 2ac9 TaxID=879212 RepID=I5AZ29_9BACT|nr:hypothetical protein DespoDRAFT_00474 [Desulfobacter postgatei 2ac9]